MASPFVTIRSRPLSVWQSAVHKVANTSPGISPEQRELMKQAVDAHITAAKKGQAIPKPTQFSKPPTLDGHVAVSADAFARAMARAKLAAGSTQVEPPSDTSIPLPLLPPMPPYVWYYSDDDYVGWSTCEEVYLLWYNVMGENPIYHAWTGKGGGNINYGVCNVFLPNDAKVLIVGDWGTGMNDAVTMLHKAISMCQPQAIIHLGDVYYSGTPDEFDDNFTGVFAKTFKHNGKSIPVFNIPGNHDYYSGGAGFYAAVTEMNGLSSQVASYFCLRTQDLQWQFLGMDTGYHDRDPDSSILFADTMVGPGLVHSEVDWHVDKLENFGGNTILLSHHQLFSANATINGSKTQYLPYLNEKLYATFLPYFKDKISAWLWGHEHSFAYYQDGLFGLSKGRLLGCSAYEEFASDNPYTVNYQQVPFASGMEQVSLSPYKDISGNSYYQHAFAVIDFKRNAPTDPINVAYYQYASWGDSTPTNPPPPSLLFNETFAKPNVTPEWIWQGNAPISSVNATTSTIGALESTSCPALAVFNNKLYMAYTFRYEVQEGGKPYYLNVIGLAWYDGSSWQNDAIINMPGGAKKGGRVAAQSQYAPALAVCAGKLCLIYLQEILRKKNQLYMAEFDGETWTGETAIEIDGETRVSLTPPAAIGFKDGILLVYSSDVSGSSIPGLCSATFDPATGAWSGFNPISTNLVNTILSNQSPKLAIYAPVTDFGQANPDMGGPEVEPQICMSYMNSAVNPVQYCAAWFDGRVWTGGEQFATIEKITLGPVFTTPVVSAATPWLAQLGDSLMAITIDGNDNISASLFDGKTVKINLGGISGWSPAKQIQNWPSSLINNPHTFQAGAAVPYGSGVFTVYFGEGAQDTTIYQAHVSYGVSGGTQTT